jgi:hypothetical protein
LEVLKIELSQLYEINTRAWIYSLQQELNTNLTLLTIPDEIWTEIINKGFDWIWLMGVWKHSALSKEELVKHPGLVQEISHSLPDWETTDVIGSPYSIVKYEINPILGEPGDLEILKNKLNNFGAKLMLDFVPNHFGSDSELVLTNPEYFISTRKTPEKKSIYKQLETKKGEQWIAYGKDPYFPPWTDTFQLNYFHENTRKYMIDALNKIANECDGIRCDMAMLCLNDIIQKTWGFHFQEVESISVPTSEFWTFALKNVKSNHPEFIFLAEVYWNLGAKLQHLGFDYTYDKDLYDKLKGGTAEEIYAHLAADKNYLQRTLKFIENHDERRALDTFGREKSIAAVTIMGTLPGMSLYYQGQFEGEEVKIPVQLRQKQSEDLDTAIQGHYNLLMEYTRQIKSRKCQWSLLNTSNPNILSWQWFTPDSTKFYLIIVNYSSFQSQGNVFLSVGERGIIENLNLIDFVNGKEYVRSTSELSQYGLFVDLKSFQSHLFIGDPL